MHDPGTSTRTPPARSPISPRGLLAARVVAVSLVVLGGLFLWASYDELTCPYIERLCNVTVAFGGLLSILSVGAIITGVGVWLSTGRRWVSEDGEDGWVAVEAALVVLGAAVVALLIRSQVCPNGYVLDRTFHVCISAADAADRVDPESRVWLQWLVFGAGVLLAVPIARQKHATRWLAAAITIAVWAGGMLWLLARTVLPRTY